MNLLNLLRTIQTPGLKFKIAFRSYTATFITSLLFINRDIIMNLNKSGTMNAIHHCAVMIDPYDGCLLMKNLSVNFSKAVGHV